MRHRALRAVVRASEAAVGRRRLAQFARLMTNEVRLDTDNDMASNGEGIVQEVALGLPNPVVLDVGAHYGEWSEALLAKATAHPVLHVFEPSAHSADRARHNLGARATVHQMALSDRVGSAELVIVHEGAGSNSLVAFTDDRRISGGTESVILGTLDDFCSKHGISHVSLLKTDAEGHDLTVLRGGAVMLGEQRIDMIQFEYNRRWIDARLFLLDAFELLQGHGYRMGKVTPRGIEVYPRWHHELETFTEGNYLAYLPRVEGLIPKLRWWGG